MHEKPWKYLHMENNDKTMEISSYFRLTALLDSHWIPLAPLTRRRSRWHFVFRAPASCLSHDSDFQTVHSGCFLFLQHNVGKMLVGYRRINNKGVLDRPWTIWKVLRAISSTLKCQFTVNHENEKIWLFGETEHRRPGAQKVAHHFSAHFCLVKTPSIAIWCQKTFFSGKPSFFQVH